MEQQELTDDSGEPLAPLRSLALRYADVRDRRMALGREENQLKKQLIGLMHQYEQELFEDPAVEVEIVKDEKLQVRVLEIQPMATDAAEQTDDDSPGLGFEDDPDDAAADAVADANPDGGE